MKIRNGIAFGALLGIFVPLSHFGEGAVLAAPPIELRTAAQDSSPKYMALASPEGKQKIGGLCTDILRALEKVDPELKFTGDQKFVPLPRIEMMLEKGEIDVFAGYTKNPERESKVVFLEPPLYNTRHVMLVRADDPIQLNSFADLSKLGKAEPIMILHGSAGHDILKGIPGVTIDAESSNLDEMLRRLLSKRRRFIFYTELSLIDAIRRRGLADQVRILPQPFRVTHQHLALSRSLPAEKVERVQKALKKLTDSGELARIWEKHNPSK